MGGEWKNRLCRSGWTRGGVAWLLLASLCGHAVAASAQPSTHPGQPDQQWTGSVYPGVLLKAGLRPRDIVAADLNGDGRVDFASADEAQTVSVMLARAGGGFEPTRTVATSVFPAAIGAADLDGDGLVDLAVCSHADDAVLLLRQEPDGSFTERPLVPLDGDPRDLSIADVNGDGAPDILCACSGAGAVRVMTNEGGMSFAEPQAYATGAGTWALTVADLDHDGASDFAASNGDVHVWLNDGAGAFFAGQTFIMPSDADSLCAADLDGDGLPELIMGTSHGPMWTMNTGSGQFGELRNAYVNAGGDAIAALDLDYDGDLDVVTCDTLRGSGATAINDGLGNLAPPNLVGLRATPVSLAPTRSRGRGGVELAVLCRDPGDVMLLEPDGSGGFRRYEMGVAGSDASQLATSDFDLDGDADVVVASSGHLDVYNNDGIGRFAYASSLPISRTPYAVAVVDLDGDGDEDVVCNAYLQQYISLYFNQGGMNFSARVDLPVASTPSELFAWRDELRGRCTLFGLHSGSVSVWSINDEGVVAGPFRMSAGTSTRDAAVGDFDANGWPDLAVARNAKSIAVFLGRGGLKFQGVPVGSFGTLTRSVGAADFDADGFDDIAVLTLDGELWTLRGSPRGFTTDLLGADRENSSDVLVGDADGDGRTDIVLLRSGSPDASESSCSLWRNTGGGTFAHHGHYAIGREVDSGAVTDIDADGDGDLLTPNNDGSLFTILRARGARRR